MAQPEYAGGDVVLLKASRGVRLERALDELVTKSDVCRENSDITRLSRESSPKRQLAEETKRR